MIKVILAGNYPEQTYEKLRKLLPEQKFELEEVNEQSQFDAVTDAEIIIHYYNIALGNALSVYEQIYLFSCKLIQNDNRTLIQFQNVLNQLLRSAHFNRYFHGNIHNQIQIAVRISFSDAFIMQGRLDGRMYTDLFRLSFHALRLRWHPPT